MPQQGAAEIAWCEGRWGFRPDGMHALSYQLQPSIGMHVNERREPRREEEQGKEQRTQRRRLNVVRACVWSSQAGCVRRWRCRKNALDGVPRGRQRQRQRQRQRWRRCQWPRRRCGERARAEVPLGVARAHDSAIFARRCRTSATLPLNGDDTGALTVRGKDSACALLLVRGLDHSPSRGLLLRRRVAHSRRRRKNGCRNARVRSARERSRGAHAQLDVGVAVAVVVTV